MDLKKYCCKKCGRRRTAWFMAPIVKCRNGGWCSFKKTN